MWEKAPLRTFQKKQFSMCPQKKRKPIDRFFSNEEQQRQRSSKTIDLKPDKTDKKNKFPKI